MTVTKDSLADLVAKENVMTKKDAKQIIDSITNIIMDATAHGEKVQLVGFGTFAKHIRPAHNGKHPSTGDTIQIKESVTAKFKPGKSYMNRLNKGE